MEAAGHVNDAALTRFRAGARLRGTALAIPLPGPPGVVDAHVAHGTSDGVTGTVTAMDDPHRDGRLDRGAIQSSKSPQKIEDCPTRAGTTRQQMPSSEVVSTRSTWSRMPSIMFKRKMYTRFNIVP
jgi:hypothetical protein